MKSTIHAFAALGPKGRLEPFRYSVPELSPHQVLLEVTHCGLCYSDVHLIDNDWKRSIYPLVPGHEVIGNIVQKGEEVPYPIGTRVGVSWYLSSCLACTPCLSGDTQFCAQRQMTCIGHHGGFGDHMTADGRFIYPIPEDLDSASAAPLLCAGATVYAPLRRFKIQATDKVAVIGIGGLGHLAIQFAHAFGCEVTAISSTRDKEGESLSFGAKHFLWLNDLDKKTDFLQTFDLILSTVHADVNWDLICSLLKYSGVLCLLGKPLGPFQVDILNSLSSQRVVTGSSVANRVMIQEMLRFAATHRIRPKIEKMRLSQVNEAVEKIRKNKAHYRIVLENI